MFAAARQQQIKELLLKHKQIDIATLAATLGVTEVTARRDLDKLEREGFATKTHGGVVLNETILDPAHDNLASEVIPPEIKEIGETAALLVRDREAIFLGGGATCLQVAINLKNKQRLTVMTNDLKVAQELSNTAGVISVVTGGNVLPGSTAVAGELALRSLERIHFTKAILSISGASFTHGFTSATVEEALLYKQLFAISDETIIVANAAKFGQIGFAFLCQLTEVQKIVTNKELDDPYKEFFFNRNIKLYTPYEVEEITALP
ncbi:DeoR family transcriptional regulator [Hydrogenispora ethanolica]|uniref:DeoR family transcriptional regulator n=1 Tax=Hydrogenispora ethanolica TaxID=1082276 RepID=A0A4R1RTL7_HYDET|nr:DeoR/GlpR family DNA-binding transcription regulator [Hydrogenispora ethanolica]TCL69885.1 DeoR family transcriptional regulator [Hydrogenispora ethanolica]